MPAKKVAKPGKPKAKAKSIDADKEAEKKAVQEAALDKKRAQRNALGQLVNATFSSSLCVYLILIFLFMSTS